MSLANIVGVISCQGFQVDEIFYVKECSLISVKDMEIISYFIRLPISSNRLERNIKITIRYCSNFIHGLSFANSKNDISFKLLKKLLMNFIQAF